MSSFNAASPLGDALRPVFKSPTVDGATPIDAAISASVSPESCKSEILDSHVVMGDSLRVPVDTCQRLSVTVFRNNQQMKDGDMFKDRVRKRRLELKMSQAQLATESGLSPGTIGDIEAGRQGGTKNIDLLAGALKTTADHLRTGDKSAPTMLESALSQRESRLIMLFRTIGKAGKGQIEAYAAGLLGAVNEPPPRVKQTAQEIRGAKSRRSG